jgi:hypothetical protein
MEMVAQKRGPTLPTVARQVRRTVLGDSPRRYLVAKPSKLGGDFVLTPERVFGPKPPYQDPQVGIVKWSDVERMVRAKLGGTIDGRGDHKKGHVHCGNGIWTFVKIGRHADLKPYDVGHCASTLKTNEHNFKGLVACPYSKEEYFAEVLAKVGYLIAQPWEPLADGA